MADVRLGQWGVWGHSRVITVERAQRLERLGFSALWEGGSPTEELGHVRAVLDATESITVATGIVNVWRADPTAVAASYHRIEADHPGRFLLGIGIGHPEATADYRSPYQTLVDYFDVLDAEGVPVQRRVLAALGPRVLRLAAERSAGAHPYLTTVEATRRERATLGSGPLLAPEQRVVLVADPVAARAIGRPSVARPYLGLRNYTANLERLGFTQDDLTPPGSDELVDALVVYGDRATVAARLNEHLAAGADHVALQLLTASADDLDAGFEELAATLIG
jgi:probable F420-dependent oxidoreductase